MNFHTQIISCLKCSEEQKPWNCPPGWDCYLPFGKVFWSVSEPIGVTWDSKKGKIINKPSPTKKWRWFELRIATNGVDREFLGHHPGLTNDELTPVLADKILTSLAKLPLPIMESRGQSLCVCSSTMIFERGCQCKGA